MKSGVSQGSNLGPLLYILDINDLLNYLSFHVLAYADYIKLYSNIKSNSDVINLQNNLDTITNWCSKNSLCLNINKCSVVTYSRLKMMHASLYCIEGSLVRSEKCVEDLGVTFDSQLRFSEHIERICVSASKALGFIIRVTREFTDLSTIKLLFQSLILSKLEYAVLIWYPICNLHVNNINRIMRKFMKYLSYKIDNIYPVRGYSTEDLLLRHNLDSLNIRRHRICAKFMFNLVHYKIDCSELLAKIPFNIPRQNSRNVATFYLPPAKTNTLVRSSISLMCKAADAIFVDIFSGQCK